MVDPDTQGGEEASGEPGQGWPHGHGDRHHGYSGGELTLGITRASSEHPCADASCPEVHGGAEKLPGGPGRQGAGHPHRPSGPALAWLSSLL